MDSTTPTPTPTPRPAVPSSLSNLFGNLLGPILVAAVLIGYDQFFRPHPESPQSPLVVAAKNYIKTLPDAYDSAAQQVKGGVLADKTAVVGALQAHAKPLAEAMDAAFAPLIDDKGKILNAPAAADVLDQVAMALKKGGAK